MAGGPAIVILGAAGEPTASLVRDVRRLGYLPEVIEWPTDRFPPMRHRPLAALVDFRALGVDAAQACRRLRAAGSFARLPLLAVVAEQEAPRMDLSPGFDDLILAPYRLSELMARLRLIQWKARVDARPGVIRVGPLAINPATYEVVVRGAPVELTLKEYQLLLFLARNPGRVYTRGELLDSVWGAEYFGGTRTVDVHVRRLRAKAGEAGEMVETVRGVGYRLVHRGEGEPGER